MDGQTGASTHWVAGRRSLWRAIIAAGILGAAIVAFAAPPAFAATCGNGQGGAMLLGCFNNISTDATVLISSTTGPGLYVGANGSGSSGLEGHGSATGVLGSGTTYGVFGTTTAGTGVYGETTGSTGVGVWGKTVGNGSAVYGQNTGAAGTGVFGDATTGTGVLAHSTSGVALAVNGTAHFSQSGLALVPSGVKSVTVTLAGVTTASMILATVQQSGGFYVKYAVPAAGSFTIAINKAPTSPTTVKVAYFVLS